MGCTCAYNTDNANTKPMGIDEFEDKKIFHNAEGSKSTLQEDLIRMTSMSRISSQRSILLNNMKKTKESKEPMKIGNLDFRDYL